MNAQRFGGPWTERKLQALEKYLSAYLTIFKTNHKAAKFTRHYVDAFAGSGWRSVRDTAPVSTSLDLGDADETLEYLEGSVRKVLSMEKDFHRYWFVEKDSEQAESLRQMISEDFPNRAALCEVIEGDANEFLIKWADSLGPMDRAVVFLDPYGMTVQWTMVEKLARTKKIDLWMLFPVSSVFRMLPKQGPPNEAWSQRPHQIIRGRELA